MYREFAGLLREPHDGVVTISDDFGDLDAFDALVSEIAEAVTVVGQEQVDLLLTAIDDARTKLVAAIKTSHTPPKPGKSTVAEPFSPPAAPAPSQSGSKPGHLF